MDPELATELLRRYAAERSEDAFGLLVRGHAGLVYGTALRRTHGDAALAEDAAQLTFIALGRHAGKIQNGARLAAWLHRTAANTATSLVRSDAARRTRESAAMAIATGESPGWLQLAPVLDRCLLELSDSDRRLLTMRYLNGTDLRTIGRAESITEDAAGKRVRKALEKLRSKLNSKGLQSPSAMLATLLEHPEEHALPSGCASKWTASSMAAVSGSGPAFQLLRKPLVACGGIAAALAVGVVVWSRAGQTPNESVGSSPIAPVIAEEPAREPLDSSRREAQDSSALLTNARNLCDSEELDFYDRKINEVVRLLAPLPVDVFRKAIDESDSQQQGSTIESHLRHALLKAWAVKDSAGALKCAMARSDDRLARSMVLNAWIPAEPAKALAWLVEHPSGDDRDVYHVAAAIGKLLGTGDYDPLAFYLGGDDEHYIVPMSYMAGKKLQQFEIRKGLKLAVMRLQDDAMRSRARDRLTEFFEDCLAPELPPPGETNDWPSPESAMAEQVMKASSSSLIPASELPADLTAKIRQQLGRSEGIQEDSGQAVAIDPLVKAAQQLPVELLDREILRAESISDPKSKTLMLDVLLAARAQSLPEEALKHAIAGYPTGTPARTASFALLESFRPLVAKSPDDAMTWLEAHPEVRQPLLPVLSTRLLIEDRRFDQAARLARIDPTWRVSDDLFSAALKHPEDFPKVVEQLPGMPVGPHVERVAYDIGLAVKARRISDETAEDWMQSMVVRLGSGRLQKQMEKGKARGSFIWTLNDE